MTTFPAARNLSFPRRLPLVLSRGGKFAHSYGRLPSGRTDYRLPATAHGECRLRAVGRKDPLTGGMGSHVRWGGVGWRRHGGRGKRAGDSGAATATSHRETDGVEGLRVALDRREKLAVRSRGACAGPGSRQCPGRRRSISRRRLRSCRLSGPERTRSRCSVMPRGGSYYVAASCRLGNGAGSKDGSVSSWQMT